MFAYVMENNNSVAISGITITNARSLIGISFNWFYNVIRISILLSDISVSFLNAC